MVALHRRHGAEAVWKRERCRLGCDPFCQHAPWKRSVEILVPWTLRWVCKGDASAFWARGATSGRDGLHSAQPRPHNLRNQQKNPPEAGSGARFREGNWRRECNKYRTLSSVRGRQCALKQIGARCFRGDRASSVAEAVIRLRWPLSSRLLAPER